MAVIITTDHKMVATSPKDHKDFKLDELQKIVGGYIEVVYLQDNEIMVINENGKFDCEVNDLATSYAFSNGARIAKDDYICGNVLVCKNTEVL